MHRRRSLSGADGHSLAGGLSRHDRRRSGRITPAALTLHLLDTDTVIYILKRRSPDVAAHFEKCSPEEVAISAVSIAELMYGAEKSEHPVRARRAVERIADLLRVLPFDEGAARVYGKVRGHLEKLGTPIGALDTLIGAHSLFARATLVTNNVREFERIPGLRVENWTAT